MVLWRTLIGRGRAYRLPHRANLLQRHTLRQCRSSRTENIVLPKYHAVIFVHGCFWHRHPGCKYAYTP
ncbi:MAG: hypothetical protein II793_07635, partial [Bacteroidales bacterium]|nr:hypothetical protein [Bacteroidales bacterium]